MTRVMLLTVLVLILVPADSNAQILVEGKQFSLRGTIGYGQQSLEDINNWIKSDEQLFQSYGIPVEWDEFGGAKDLGGEFGIKISKGFSIGIGINYQNNSVSNSYSDYTGSISDEMELQVLDFTVNFYAFLPGTNGLFVGANGGFSFGGYDGKFTGIIYDDPAADYTAITSASGKGPMVGIFAGYELNFSSGLQIFGKFGYRYRNLKSFSGGTSDSDGDRWSHVITDSNGNNIEFDFSGLYLLVGLGISFGSKM